MSTHLLSSARAFAPLLVLLITTVAAHAGSPLVPASQVATPPLIIVIGFLGGYVKHDAMNHSTAQVATRLRQEYSSSVHTEVLENHRREKAYADIVRLMDSDHDGTLSLEEKKNARIILYGHSWGASAAITLARELEQESIPVLLTIQVDSVSRDGQNDKDIPANVAEAANFFQLDGLLHGQSRIRASDPKRTRIIGNFRSNYKDNPVDCRMYPWYDRLFMRSHIEIESDPKVWSQVQTIIESKLAEPSKSFDSRPSR